jgi:hypothetical protein
MELLLIVVLVLATIWVMAEIKRFNHRVLIMISMFLVLMFFISVSLAFHGESISLNNFDDFKSALGIYFSWLGQAFGNLKVITAKIISMDWSAKG